jgi:hypothetical protein
MQEFTTTTESIEWLTAEEYRVLVLRAKHHEYCESYFLTTFTDYAEAKTNYEFACIDEEIFTDEITLHNHEKRYIIGMGAPIPIERLDEILSD